MLDGAAAMLSAFDARQDIQRPILDIRAYATAEPLSTKRLIGECKHFGRRCHTLCRDGRQHDCPRRRSMATWPREQCVADALHYASAARDVSRMAQIDGYRLASTAIFGERSRCYARGPQSPAARDQRASRCRQRSEEESDKDDASSPMPACEDADSASMAVLSAEARISATCRARPAAALPLGHTLR